MMWLLACTPPDDPGVTSPLSEAPPDAARVIIVVLDGVRVEESIGTPGADHPSLTGEPPEAFLPEVYATLLPEAAVLYGARNIGVTTTYDAHVELLTGLRQPLVTFPTGESGLWRSEAPTLFEAARRAEGLAEDQVLLMGNTPLLEELTWGLWPGMGPGAAASWRFRTDADAQDLRDAQVVEDLVAWLGVHDTRLAVVNLHRMDLAGHIEPDLSYIDRIRQADPAVAGLWRWISDTPPYSGNTTLFVMADHGRHRTDVEPDAWRNHGDQCDGCRSIPLIVAGPGVAAGAQPDPGSADPARGALGATLADIGATAAWRLGVSLPLGRGRVLTELFEASFIGRFGAIPQAGAGALSVAGGVSVREEGAGLAGAMVTPEGVHAEAPVIAAVETAAGGAILACWRELGVAGSAWGAGIWGARCSADGQDTGFPAVEGSADWEGSLLADPAGGAWLGWIHNPTGDAGASLVRPRIARWDSDTGWETDALSPPEISYPTRPSLAHASGLLRFAAATSDGESTGRDSRSITVWSVDAGRPMAQQWTQLLQIRPDGEFLSMDRPALRPDGGGLAWLGIDAEGGVSVLIQGDPAGIGARLVAGSGVIALTGLRWMEESEDWSLVWARMGDGGTVEVVRWDGREQVIGTGLPWVAGLALTEGGVLLSGPDGVETFLF